MTDADVEEVVDRLDKMAHGGSPKDAEVLQIAIGAILAIHEINKVMKQAPEKSRGPSAEEGGC